MPKKQTGSEPIDGGGGKDSDPTAEEVNRLHDLLDETGENAMRRIDVLEDMLDILNER